MRAEVQRPPYDLVRLRSGAPRSRQGHSGLQSIVSPYLNGDRAEVRVAFREVVVARRTWEAAWRGISLAAATAALALITLGAAGVAQGTYPSRPVHLLVPFQRGRR